MADDEDKIDEDVTDEEPACIVIKPGFATTQEDIQRVYKLFETIIDRVNANMRETFELEMMAVEDIENSFSTIENGIDECEHIMAVTTRPYKTNDIIDLDREMVGDDDICVCIKCHENFDLVRNLKEAKEQSVSKNLGT